MGKLSPAGVLRLRARSAVPRDPSVRRSAQDDEFVGVSKASGRGHLPSFIHPTRKLVVIEIAAVPPGLSLEKESSPTLYGQVTSWERMLSRRNTEFSLNLVVLPVLIEALVI